MSTVLTMKQFRAMMNEYNSSFEKAPSSAHQLVQFSKEKEYGFKYTQIKTMLSIWQREQTQGGKTQQTTTKCGNKVKQQQKKINFDSLWDEYQTKYGYSPKTTEKFWSFMKEEKALFVKFKAVQSAFARISKERKVSAVQEGASLDNLTDCVLAQQGKDNDIALNLKISDAESSEQLETIKAKFCELLQCFRATICDDPRSPLHFYHFINDRTKYKVPYCDVQSAYKYALKNEWFEPMKRLYKNEKIYKEQTDEGSDDGQADEGLLEFELVIDTERSEKIKKEQKNDKKAAAARDVMSDDDLDKILREYGATHENKPKNAAQIQKFGREIGQPYKWKAVRIAFMRWVEFRGGNMPK